MEDFIKELGIENPYKNEVQDIWRKGQASEEYITNMAYKINGFDEAIPIVIKAYIEYMDKPCTEHPVPEVIITECGDGVMYHKSKKMVYPTHRRDCPLCQARVHEVLTIKEKNEAI